MKKMTAKHIDEVNELLKDHSEALTAFYDEAYYAGADKGMLWGGMIVGAFVAGCIVARIESKIKERKNKVIE